MPIYLKDVGVVAEVANFNPPSLSFAGSVLQPV